uniref:AIG1-type G domain-containing protein n=1 Tax=Timspurckia oligopyrenoides TaxID=708627 RepID=A0A7S1ESZ4_9RHOD|mmetsp:Transcript_5034/g.8780  ORF Transcript_5034/g.8780 Transcript_5034/m.8780 type:complete len:1048 (+) Transcript_5034:249-3392(+)|eukprot:CAMPEP_0182444506 /NCGR_PEP_ID=MMETSP1172-20130603/2934_1 /TAXON_ID=708627 /ORGANISM="Timspurckia oligopyrenoides, Strain CCMP3278" /LENGTH=1047 /DNA_ID=CAMNT_0024640071 /DNA_START=175 /DNA_END=3318 /DNA_ORIENTATION=+
MKTIVLGERGVGKHTIYNAAIHLKDVETRVPAESDFNGILLDLNDSGGLLASILKADDTAVVVFVIEAIEWKLRSIDMWAMHNLVKSIQRVNADANVRFGVIINKVDDDSLKNWHRKTDECLQFKSVLCQLGCAHFLPIAGKQDGGEVLNKDESAKIKGFLRALPSVKLGSAAEDIGLAEEVNCKKESEELAQLQKSRLDNWAGIKRIELNVFPVHQSAQYVLTNQTQKITISKVTQVKMEVKWGLLEFRLKNDVGKYHFFISMLDYDPTDQEFSLELESNECVVLNGSTLRGTTLEENNAAANEQIESLDSSNAVPSIVDVSSTPETAGLMNEPFKGRRVLVIGETGAGKSTISNSLVGGAAFQSGPSEGGGLTTEKKSVVVDGIELIDVPGYNDAKKENIHIASKAVSEALKESALLSVVFVIELSPWRLRNTDANAMIAVVDALKGLNDERIQFGVIINKVNEEFLQEWTENTLGCVAFKSFMKILGCVNILFVEKAKGMTKKMNVMLSEEKSKEIKEFVLALPQFNTGPSAGNIDFDSEDKIKQAGEMLKTMKQNLNDWAGMKEVSFVINPVPGGLQSVVGQNEQRWLICAVYTLPLQVNSGLLEFGLEQGSNRTPVSILLLDKEFSNATQLVIQLEVNGARVYSQPRPNLNLLNEGIAECGSSSHKKVEGRPQERETSKGLGQPASLENINIKVLVLGETGVGKSTISNSLVNDASFESGPSDGGGLTVEKKSRVVGGVEYIDVPGYNDAKKENINIASKAVSKILKESGPLVAVFVIELIPWRLKNTDICAMSGLVSALNTMNDNNVKFGVIINKADEEFLEEWSEGTQGCSEFKALLTQLGCVDILVLEKRRGMGKKRNVMLMEVDADNIKKFVLALPPIQTGPTAGNIDFDNESKIKEAAQMVTKIKQNVDNWQGVKLIKFTVQHKHECSESKLYQMSQVQKTQKWRISSDSAKKIEMEVKYGVLMFRVTQILTTCNFSISMLDFPCGDKFVLELLSAGSVQLNGRKSNGTLSETSERIRDGIPVLGRKLITSDSDLYR